MPDTNSGRAYTGRSSEGITQQRTSGPVPANTTQVAPAATEAGSNEVQQETIVDTGAPAANAAPTEATTVVEETPQSQTETIAMASAPDARTAAAASPQQQGASQTQTVSQSGLVPSISDALASMAGVSNYNEGAENGIESDTNELYDQRVNKNVPYVHDEDTGAYQLQDEEQRNETVRAARRTASLGAVNRRNRETLASRNLIEEDQSKQTSDTRQNPPQQLKETRPSVANQRPRPSSTTPDELPFETSKLNERQAGTDITSKLTQRGYAVVGKMIVDDSISSDEVSVGTDIIREAIKQPDSALLELLVNYSHRILTPNSTVAEIIGVINDPQFRLKVVTSKSPTNTPMSSPVRYLRVHEGDGIRLRSSQFKMYNADADGDGITVQFNWASRGDVLTSRAYMIGVDGVAAIDPDFFPMPFLENDEATRDMIRKNILDRRFIGTSGYEHETEFMTALFELSRDSSNMENWRVLFLIMNDIAYSQRGDIDRNFAHLLDRTYDTMKRIQQLRIESIVTASDYVAPVDETEHPLMAPMIECIREGKLPNNIQDFCVLYGLNAYEIEGGNALWRDVAGEAKGMRMDTRIVFGDNGITPDNADKATVSQVYECTMRYMMAKVISNRATAGTRERDLATKIRNDIIRAVGMPRDYDNVTDFLTAFCDEYERQSSLANVAQYSFTYDYTPQRPRENTSIFPEVHRTVLKSVTSALIRIYGDFKMGELFSGVGIRAITENNAPDVITSTDRQNNGFAMLHARNRNHTLREVSKRADIQLPKRDIRIYSNYNFDGPQFHDKKKNTYHNQTLLIGAIYLIAADKRSGAASRFNKRLYDYDTESKTVVGGIFNEMQKCIQVFNKLLDKDGYPTDHQLFLDKQLELLQMIDPNMFYYFQMDTWSGFINSKYGQLLLKAKGPSEVGSIWFSMVYEYRTSKVSDAARAMLIADPDTDEVAETANRMSFVLHDLEESSEVWQVLVHDLRMRKEDTWFYQLKHDDQLHRTNGGRFFERGGQSYYNKKWLNDKHESIEELILDTELSYEDKMNALADLVRYATLNSYYNSYQVPYGMVLDKNPDITSRITTDDGGIFDTLDKANRAFNRKLVSRDDALEQVQKAKEKYYTRWYAEEANRPDPLETYLSTLSRNRSAHVNMDRRHYGDAIVAAMDPTYADSEKGRQQATVSAFYQGKVLQRAGRMSDTFDDLDQRLLMVTSQRNLTLFDIVNVLADPNYELPVYDKQGRLTDTPITRASLCGGDRVADVWAFLEKYPFIAMALRRHEICEYEKEGKGRSFLAANYTLEYSMSQYVDSTNETPNIIAREEVRSIVEDCPRFGALISLMFNVRGQVKRNLESRVPGIEDDLLWVIEEIASALEADASFNIRTYMEKRLGLTREKLTLNGVDGLVADSLLTDIEHDLREYAGITKMVFDNTRGAEMRQRDKSVTKQLYDPDLSLQDVRMYYDVKQHLTGAKTEVSVGVEGSQTKRLAVWMALLAPQDGYDDMGTYNMGDINPQIIGGMLLDGTVLTADNIPEILQAIPAGEQLIVEMPPGATVYDPTLNEEGYQIPAVARHIIIKREKAAEQFNLKAKKFGDDGLDSVTKLRPRPTQFRDYYELLAYLKETRDRNRVSADPNASRAENGLMAAQIRLAQYMQSENEALGYTELELRDYVNIASLMLVQNADGELALRSIDQIATAIANRMPMEELRNANYEELHAIAQEIADEVGFTPYEGSHAELFAGVGVYGNSEFRTLTNERTSSAERNHELIMRIHEETKAAGYNNGRGVIPLTHNQIYGRDLGDEDLKSQKVNDSPTKGYYSLADRIRQLEVYKKFNKEVLKKNGAVRGFDIVGVIGANPELSIGGQYMWLYSDAWLRKVKDPNKVDKIARDWLGLAERLGITVAVEAKRDAQGNLTFPDAIRTNDTYMANLIPIAGSNQNPGDSETQWFILPFFDMLLNGKYTDPMYMGQGSTWISDPSMLMAMVEDQTNDYATADAYMDISKWMVDNLHITWAEPKDVPIADLFPTVWAENPKANFSFSMATSDEIEHLLNVYDQDRGDDTMRIDYGVLPGEGKAFERRKEWVHKRIERYEDAYTASNGDGILYGTLLNAEDIVGWGKIHVVPEDGTMPFDVFAPLMLYNNLPGESKTVPRTYELTALSPHKDEAKFEIGFKWSGDLSHAILKVFSGFNASNKFMADASQAKDMGLLRNGMPVACATSMASSASRMMGEMKRLYTVESMMAVARCAPYGFNWAEKDASFPDDPELKERLRLEEIPLGEWRQLWDDRDGYIKFSNDTKIDAFLNESVQTCLNVGVNPSNFLASRFDHKDACVWFEFATVMNGNIEWQDNLMYWYHQMMPTLCPPGVDNFVGNNPGYLFLPCKPVAEGKPDPLHTIDYENCLQMEVPHFDYEDGHQYYVRQNVYICWNFFGEEFGGFHIPSVNGSARQMDQTVALAVAGKTPSQFELDNMLKWASSGMRRPNAMSIIADPVETEKLQQKYNDYDDSLEDEAGA